MLESLTLSVAISLLISFSEEQEATEKKYFVERYLIKALLAQMIVIAASFAITYFFFDAIYGNQKVEIDILIEERLDWISKIILGSFLPLALLRFIKLLKKYLKEKKDL